MVRDVVAAVAAEELPVIDGLTQFDDAVVVRRLGGRARSREPLGFGLGEIAVLVTPVVWLVLDQVAKQVADAAMNGAARGTRVLLRKVFGRRAAPVTVPPLTAEQLGEVRSRILETAARRGLDPQLALAIADTVVARLASIPPGEDGQGFGPDRTVR